MNIRNHLIELQCTQRHVPDVAQAIVHSLLFFRTYGKFNYKHEESYSVGTLGFERVNCDTLDFSYIRCSSNSLINCINNKIQEISQKLKEYSNHVTISLEFYTKKPGRWLFNDSKIVWELWNIKLVIVPSQKSGLTVGANYLNNYHYHQQNTMRPHHSDQTIRLEDLLSHKLLDIVKIVNSDKCTLPPMPNQPNLENIFDTSHDDLQPYLHTLSYKIGENPPGGFSSNGPVGIKADTINLVSNSSPQSSLKKFLLGTLEL